MINLNSLSQYLSQTKVLIFLTIIFFVNLAWFQTLPFDTRFYMLDTYFAFNHEDISRIIEVIGQDDLEALDEDTIYFIISALNQLDIDYIRNKILLKVLPLKV